MTTPVHGRRRPACRPGRRRRRPRRPGPARPSRGSTVVRSAPPLGSSAHGAGVLDRVEGDRRHPLAVHRQAQLDALGAGDHDVRAGARRPGAGAVRGTGPTPSASPAAARDDPSALAPRTSATAANAEQRAWRRQCVSRLRRRRTVAARADRRAASCSRVRGGMDRPAYLRWRPDAPDSAAGPAAGGSAREPVVYDARR